MLYILPAAAQRFWVRFSLIPTGVITNIVSFNVNGIRARLHQLQAICATLRPDVLALQETKVKDEAFPYDAVKSLGYEAHAYGQAGHYGVALLSKYPCIKLQCGLINELPGAQRRLITGQFVTPSGGMLTIINGYFPQGENRDHPVKFPYKKQFYADLATYVQNSFKPEDPILVVGDMNVAPEDADVGIGKANAIRWLKTGACGFLPEERLWLNTIANWGLVDLFRVKHPQVTDKFSWFDYRSRGFEAEPRRGLRLDLILGTQIVAQRCKDAGVDYAIRAMEKPSDHCPVWVAIDI